MLRDLKKYEEGTKIYEKLIKEKYSVPDVYNNYANFLKSQKKYDEAEKYYLLAV